MLIWLAICETEVVSSPLSYKSSLKKPQWIKWSSSFSIIIECRSIFLWLVRFSLTSSGVSPPSSKILVNSKVHPPTTCVILSQTLRRPKSTTRFCRLSQAFLFFTFYSAERMSNCKNLKALLYWGPLSQLLKALMQRRDKDWSRYLFVVFYLYLSPKIASLCKQTHCQSLSSMTTEIHGYLIHYPELPNFAAFLPS